MSKIIINNVKCYLFVKIFFNCTKIKQKVFKKELHHFNIKISAKKLWAKLGNCVMKFYYYSFLNAHDYLKSVWGKRIIKLIRILDFKRRSGEFNCGQKREIVF